MDTSASEIRRAIAADTGASITSWVCAGEDTPAVQLRDRVVLVSASPDGTFLWSGWVVVYGSELESATDRMQSRADEVLSVAGAWLRS